MTLLGQNAKAHLRTLVKAPLTLETTFDLRTSLPEGRMFVVAGANAWVETRRRVSQGAAHPTARRAPSPIVP